MKNMKHMKWLVIGVILLIALCIFLTFLIVHHATAKEVNNEPWMQSTEEGNTKTTSNQEILLENVYITNIEDGKITFLYQGGSYTLKGKMDQDILGIANIEIKNQKIKKIYTKQDYIEGTLLSYTDEQIEVEGYGMIPCERKVNVYSDYSDEIRAISMNDLVVGASNLRYFVAENQICAVVESQKTTVQDIRVLIKNANQTTYSSLYLTSDVAWSVDDVVYGPNEIVNLKQYMVDHEKTLIQIRAQEAGMLYLTDENGNIISNGYEGTFYARAYDVELTRIVLINELPIEDYVRYVLPSEMPETFSYEALKAQAVCARTFAYAQMTDATYAAYGANLDNTTSFQVYNEGGTKAITDQAVEETTGQVVCYDGELITCYYYSTNPGVSENLEIWGKEQLPYIQKYSSLISEVEAMKTQGEETKNQHMASVIANQGLEEEKNLVSFIDAAPESYDSASPFYRWRAELDLSEVYDSQMGKLRSIHVSKRTDCGFVIRLTLVYENGSKMLEDENEIRSFLAPYMTKLVLSNGSERENFPLLPSDCFYIAAVTEDLHYVLKGGGYGHGVGMSQYGADAMGKAGYTYEEIIQFYYSGVTIEPIGM